jgi:hypothetical protein
VRTYKHLKGISPEIVQCHIELYTSIPRTHHARYRLNPNYAFIVKQDINTLLVTSFTKPIEETT